MTAEPAGNVLFSISGEFRCPLLRQLVFVQKRLDLLRGNRVERLVQKGVDVGVSLISGHAVAALIAHQHGHGGDVECFPTTRFHFVIAENWHERAGFALEARNALLKRFGLFRRFHHFSSW